MARSSYETAPTTDTFSALVFDHKDAHTTPALNITKVRAAHRRRSGWNSGGTHGEGRRWIGADCGRVWGGVSPLQPTRVSGGAS